MWLQSSEDVPTNNTSGISDARHRNRFHIRRTKKGDIKATETGKGRELRRGSPKLGDEPRDPRILLCVCMYVCILYIHKRSMNL